MEATKYLSLNGLQEYDALIKQEINSTVETTLEEILRILRFMDGAPNFIEKEIAANNEYLASDDGADGYSKVTVNVPTTIKVEELPTENIDTGKVYEKVVFTGVASPYETPDGTPSAYLLFEDVGTYYFCKTKPTENIDSIGEFSSAEDYSKIEHFYWYYIEDEDNIFAYTDKWISIVEFFNILSPDTETTYGGVISDINEAIGGDDSLYALITTVSYHKYINGEWVDYNKNPIPTEATTEAEMNALLETAEVGTVYKYTGETTEAFENGALYVVEESE